jgi:hypothetical protein
MEPLPTNERTIERMYDYTMPRALLLYFPVLIVGSLVSFSQSRTYVEKADCTNIVRATLTRQYSFAWGARC